MGDGRLQQQRLEQVQQQTPTTSDGSIWLKEIHGPNPSTPTQNPNDKQNQGDSRPAGHTTKQGSVPQPDGWSPMERREEALRRTNPPEVKLNWLSVLGEPANHDKPNGKGYSAAEKHALEENIPMSSPSEKMPLNSAIEPVFTPSYNPENNEPTKEQFTKVSAPGETSNEVRVERNGTSEKVFVGSDCLTIKPNGEFELDTKHPVKITHKDGVTFVCLGSTMVGFDESGLVSVEKLQRVYTRPTVSRQARK